MLYHLQAKLICDPTIYEYDYISTCFIYITILHGQFIRKVSELKEISSIRNCDVLQASITHKALRFRHICFSKKLSHELAKPATRLNLSILRWLEAAVPDSIDILLYFHRREDCIKSVSVVLVESMRVARQRHRLFLETPHFLHNFVRIHMCK
jgi:hypothetical protein